MWLREIEGGRRKLKIPLEGARENERARRRAGDAGWVRKSKFGWW